MSHNKPLLFLSFLLLSIAAKAQIRFEKGYFIDNENVRTVCAIRNVDWESNPTAFRYKLPDSDEVMEASIREVQAFGIDNGYSYVRTLAKVDHSSTDVNQLSKGRNPDYQEELVFLKLLVSGETKLFLYRQAGVSQFYYQKSDGGFLPLVYKRYIDDNGQTATNFGFRQQLLNDLVCERISRLQIERTLYREGDLVRLFEQYNACKNPGGKPVGKPAGRQVFNVKITPGADINFLKTSSFTFTESGGRERTSAAFRVGAEVEYFAAFHKNKWSILVEPAFQMYQFPLRVNSVPVDLDFWTIELPMGIRHHFYLSEKTKIFVNALYSWKLKETAKKGDNASTDYRVIAKSGFAGGVGFAHGPLSLEARYYLNRNVYAYRARVDMEYSKLSLILGYRLFSK